MILFTSPSQIRLISLHSSMLILWIFFGVDCNELIGDNLMPPNCDRISLPFEYNLKMFEEMNSISKIPLAKTKKTKQKCYKRKYDKKILIKRTFLIDLDQFRQTFVGKLDAR